jgi:hypothetical protein
MYITIGLADVQTTPHLLGREDQPRAYTLYVDIDLAICLARTKAKRPRTLARPRTKTQ